MEVNNIVVKATRDDIVGIYNLLHRKFIKKYFQNSEKIEWEKHKKWYEFCLKSSYYSIYVMKDSGKKIIGQVRYEIDDEIAIINIYLDQKNRGKGLSKILLEKSIEGLKADKNQIKLIVAYILEENDVSKKLFSNFSFVYEGKKVMNKIEHLIYTKEIR